MPHLREYISPSQIKTARTCMRKWVAEYCYGMTSPESKAQALGKKVHALLEAYETKGEVPSESTIEGRVALAMMRHAPGPETAGLLVEQEILVPGNPKNFYGFIDYIVFPFQLPEREGEVGILVGDHKTTSDFQYALAEEQLRNDPQAIIYGNAGLIAYAAKYGKDPDFVVFRHTYGRTRGSAQSMTSQAVFTPGELREALQRLEAFSQQMLDWQNTPMSGVPFNLDACGAYGGCHLRIECAKLGVHSLGDQPNARAVAQLMSSGINTRAEEAEPLTPVAQDAMNRLLRRAVPKQGEPMGFLSNVIAAEVAKLQEAPVAEMQAAPVEPEAPFSINPPDGDAKGESQALTTAVTSGSVAEDTAGEDEGADGNYVQAPEETTMAASPSEEAKEEPKEEPAVEPKSETKAENTVVYGQGKVLRDSVAQLLVQASSKPDVLHKLEVLAKTDTRVKWLLSGNTSSLRLNAQWQALQDILKAALEGIELPSAPAPAPKPKAAAPVAVENDPEVKTALDAEAAALTNQVNAKQQLVQAQDKFKVLMQGDDDDAIMAFRSEVVNPAKAAVAQADNQVLDAQRQLADARAAALVRAAEAKAKAEKDAQTKQTTQSMAAAKEQVEQAQPNPAAAEGITMAWQQVGGAKSRGIPTPALFVGAIPTRQAFVHLSDLLMPYIMRVQQEHKVAYYGAIRSDGANRVIEALLADVHGGILELPDIVVAHAVPMHLEGRALEALRPFFLSVFESVR